MGFRGQVSRLANANQVRDWRLYADFAQTLIRIARSLYANEAFGLDLQEVVYALDSTTIDLCLTLFPWAKFRKRKGAVKLHTLLDLRGSIPTLIYTTHGKVHDIKFLCRDKLLRQKRLSKKIEACPILRLREQKTLGIPNQQFFSSRPDHCRTISMPLAGRIVLQMDQTTVTDQGFLGNFCKCGKDSSMDGHFN